MTLKKRLDKLEVKTPEFKPGIPAKPPPEAIELLAKEIIRRVKNGTAEPELLGVVPELLRSEHVPQELKEELKAL